MKMKKNCFRITAVILTLIMAFSSFAVLGYAAEELPSIPLVTAAPDYDTAFGYLTADNIDSDLISNTVVIPGVFQSRTRLYNDDGTVAVNSEGDEYEAPFFLEATNDIVKMALKKCLGPLLLTLITQNDFGGKLAKSVASVIGWAVGEKVKNDAEGNLVYNVKADKYEDSVATLSEEDKEYIYSQIPLNDYAEIAGEDHLYFYSYASISNLDSVVDELYQLIIKAAKASPTGKANIVPISQGGSLANNLLERYPEVGKYLDRIIYIVPALDGTLLLGDIYGKGIIDDDESLYSEVFPILVYDDDQPWLGSLINVALRILPNKVVNSILDEAVDCLVGDYIKYATTMWGLVDTANYEIAADKYLGAPEDAFIRAQTDKMYEAQLDRFENIEYQMDTYGVTVFNVVDYNYPLYPIADNWKVNGDGVIHLSSTSMGAYSVGIDTQLPDDYVPVKGEKYVDKYRLVDAGAGLLPDTTFYFHNQGHESTARNDVIMKLATTLLTDNDFVSVDSYPEKYPQFNETRDAGGLQNDIKKAKALDTSSLSAEDKAELDAAVEEAQAELDNTVVDTAKFDAAKAKFYKAYDKARGIEEKAPTIIDKIGDKVNDGLTVFFTWLSSFLFSTLKGKGFSDIFRIF